MSFRLVSSAGDIADPAMINLPCSGVINANTAVDLIRAASAGTGNAVSPSGTSSTTTMIFGVGLDYIQGASDVYTRVVPFLPEQIWEVDCANATVTAQIGVTHALSASRGFVHNTGSSATTTGVFLALGASSLTTGSGKLIGRFISGILPMGQNSTTYV